jgi:hypothetical protein
MLSCRPVTTTSGISISSLVLDSVDCAGLLICAKETPDIVLMARIEMINCLNIL